MLTFSVLPAAELKKRLMKKAPANKPLTLAVMLARKTVSIISVLKLKSQFVITRE
jgi:hypothetical protein